MAEKGTTPEKTDTDAADLKHPDTVEPTNEDVDKLKIADVEAATGEVSAMEEPANVLSPEAAPSKLPG